MMKFTKRFLLTLAAAGLILGAAAAAAGTPKLDGAKVFRDNCTKCHSERSPMEKTDDEWAVVVTHMRTLGGLTADEARAVLKFLQENNGSGAR